MESETPNPKDQMTLNPKDAQTVVLSGGRREGIPLVESQDDVVLIVVAALLDLGVLVGILAGIGIELDVRQVGAAFVHVCNKVLLHLFSFV